MGRALAIHLKNAVGKFEQGVSVHVYTCAYVHACDDTAPERMLAFRMKFAFEAPLCIRSLCGSSCV